jgi:hypothetical protein
MDHQVYLNLLIVENHTEVLLALLLFLAELVELLFLLFLPDQTIKLEFQLTLLMHDEVMIHYLIKVLTTDIKEILLEKELEILVETH